MFRSVFEDAQSCKNAFRIDDVEVGDKLLEAATRRRRVSRSNSDRDNDVRPRTTTTNSQRRRSRHWPATRCPAAA